MSTTGSSYETYNDTHKNYDKTRLAVGNSQLVNMLGLVDLRGLRILDAGCGTGVHLTAFHEAGARNLTGLDASVTGLAQAAGKFARPEDVNLVCGDIRLMPFPEGSFDLIVFSFVIHHLPHQNEAELTAATSALFASAEKLLAPGGKLAVITCTPRQLSATEGCMWYYKYFSPAAASLASRFLPVPTMQKVFTDCGFADLHIAPVEKTYWTEASLDPEGPFDNDWRSGDSLFALCAAQPERFAVELATLRSDIESGAAGSHIAAVRARAEMIKQATIFLATKETAPV